MRHPATGPIEAPGPGLSRRLVVVMAVATGAVVANLYYAQPLLHQIATSFGVDAAAASLIVTATQVGYAAGLLLIVPLGDLHPRRRLVVIEFALAAVTMAAAAVAPTLGLFEAASVLAGLASVAGQIMVPFAADLAPAESRGRVVARVMSGLLLGILLARTVAGLVAQAAGWRAIFWFSAALMAVLAVVLARVLPGEPARPKVPYVALVGASLGFLRRSALLRRRALHGACGMAAFSVLWTSVAFLLSGSPYRYSNAVIGLFGLAGVAGVAAANLAGRLADQRRTGLVTAAAGVLIAGAFGVLAAGTTSVVAVVAGIVLLDAGVQGLQITNQSIIYAIDPGARSRINSAYMFCYFLGGAAGSVAAGIVFAHAGWHDVCLLGIAVGALSLVTSAYERLVPLPVPEGAPAEVTAEAR